MATNSAPIYSGQGDNQGGELLTTAALLDYSGTNANNVVAFTSDGTYGGYIQKIRFKAAGTNAATVARIYINNGLSRAVSSSAAAVQPSGTMVTTGGNLLTGATNATYFAKLVVVDQYGGFTAAGTVSASVANTTATTSTGSITWTWTAVAGAKSYKLYVGPAADTLLSYFSANSSPYIQTEPVGTRDSIGATTNNYLYGEISLPATTAIATAATVDIDYPLNFALGPGQRIVVGLANTVAAGWYVTGIGGSYAPIA